MMKKIASITAALVLSFSALAQVPYPVELKKAEGVPNTGVELSKAIGKRAFAKRTASLPAFAREEAYALTVTPKGYKVEANTQLGYLRAKQTLAQMESCGSVFDYPRFGYRGDMLDISRHFRDKDFIIKQMEALAELLAADSCQEPDARTLQQELRNEMQTAIQRLTSKEQQVIRSLYFYQKSATETAQDMQCTARNVRWLRKNALGRLRAMVARRVNV